MCLRAPPLQGRSVCFFPGLGAVLAQTDFFKLISTQQQAYRRVGNGGNRAETGAKPPMPVREASLWLGPARRRQQHAVTHSDAKKGPTARRDRCAPPPCHPDHAACGRPRCSRRCARTLICEREIWVRSQCEARRRAQMWVRAPVAHLANRRRGNRPCPAHRGVEPRRLRYDRRRDTDHGPLISATSCSREQATKQHAAHHCTPSAKQWRGTRCRKA